MSNLNSFGAASTLPVGDRVYKYYSLQSLEQAGFKLVEQWIDEPGGFALTLVETT